MKGLIFEGDSTDHGGKVITASSSIVENGKRAARVGDVVSCPKKGHGVNPIVEGDPGILDNGKPVAVHLCRAACGCRIFSGDTSLGAN